MQGTTALWYIAFKAQLQCVLYAALNRDRFSCRKIEVDGGILHMVILWLRLNQRTSGMI